MGDSISNRRSHIDHRMAADDPDRGRFADASLDSRQVLGGDCPTGDAVLKLDARATLQWFEDEGELRSLAGAAGLLLAQVGYLRSRGDGLAVGDSGLPQFTGTPSSSSRSRAISRCSSPMPERSVWPLSGCE